MSTVQLSDDEAIAFAQATRKTVADTLLVKGIPTSDEDRVLLFKAIDGLSSTAIQNKRNKNEENLVANDALAKATLLKMLQLVGNRNPNEVLDGPERIIDINLDDVEVGKLVDGELNVGPSTMDYNTFAKKHSLGA